MQRCEWQREKGFSADLIVGPIGAGGITVPRDALSVGGEENEILRRGTYMV